MLRFSGRKKLQCDTSLTLRMLSHVTPLTYREGRAVAGLDTHEIDEEIARRVLLQPQMWPDVYDLMTKMGVLG